MGKKHSVLVIDDQETTIWALTRMLNSDYNVYAAKSGVEGILAAERHLPDVILLDILMLDMDGYAVITELKKSEKTMHIPVIFITGLYGDDNEEKALALGAADYITKPFSPDIVKLRLRNQIRMLEQLRTIERLSMHDQLTELPNRRSFEIRLKEEWGRSAREHTPLSALVVDIDNFKIYNDTYGHQQGDAALQAVAGIFPRVLKRTSDFAARWGGEEFIVLLYNTCADGAKDVAEQLRKHAEDMEIPGPDGITKVTVSIGANTREHGNSCSVNEFISAADMALYEAKNKGRNRVCCNVN
ncbi:MAG: diguanylate cyclase [Defluviitaleaceae bacterium]|nr:diguanylate cyclase [Defluviitaleaceae bacterium]MCL2835517.1 diguanylate cyclase [Defluviitaleaceae bacterium]